MPLKALLPDGHSLVLALLAPAVDQMRVQVNGEVVQLQVQRLGSHLWQLQLGSEQHTVVWQGYDTDTRTLRLSIDGKRTSLVLTTRADELAKLIGADAKASRSLGQLKAPMPGLIRSVGVKAGDVVSKGSTLLSLEAMKMENVIKCPADATVAEVLVKAGDAVEKGHVLVRFS